MRTKPSASQDAHLTFTAKGSAYLQPRPSTRTFHTIEPPRGKKATTLRDGLFLLMGELTSLMEKQQVVGAPSPAHPMEGFLSCLAWSLPQRPILRMQELDSIPTTPQNSRVSLRLYHFLDPLALSPAIHKPAFSMTPNMRPTEFGQSTTPAPSPIEAANHYAQYLQSWAERRE